MIKLVVSDMDGTLLGPEGTIHQRTKDTIRKLNEESIPLVLCTGRIVTGAKLHYHDLELQTPIVGCNGAIIQEPEDGKVLFSHPIPRKTAVAAFNILHKYDLYHHFYSEDTIYGERNERLIKHYRDISHKMPEDVRTPTELIPSVYHVIDHGTICLKIGFYNEDSDACKQAVAEIRALEGVTLVQSREDLFDIIANGVSKGEALQALATYYEIETSEIMAVGDQDNDISMIQAAGIGVAMGNAAPHIHAVADHVTASNREDGLAQAIEKFVLK